ncbi:MAG TPA: hypothetical protein VK175_08025 [Leadbetterella sp.]|nr:hypothetical protein [Leadbetterella sp.]
METQNKPVSFRLVKIQTEQFATFDGVFNNQKEVEVLTDASYGANIEGKTIFCKISHNFKNIEGNTFIKIALTCIFEIQPADWTRIISEDKTVLTLPKDLCIHMAMLAIGTARGVLHAKTEGTAFNIHVLPTINTLEMIPGDLTINLTPDNHGQTS